MKTYVLNAPHIEIGGDDLGQFGPGAPVPDPTCCSHSSALCNRCQAMAGQMSTDRSTINGFRRAFPVANREYDPSDVLGTPTMDFPNPFENPSKEVAPVMNSRPLVLNNAPPNGIGQPELIFTNPFA